MPTLSSFLSRFLLLALLHFTRAAFHPAKRQDTLTFQEICGVDAPDCGNGYCCYIGQECIAASPEPLCRDLFVQDFTQPAVGYSSLQADYNLLSSLLDPSNLLSLGVTITTPIPKTLPTTGRFTALPTYTENVWSSYSAATPTESAATVSSTGGAVLKNLNRGVVVGGIVGVFAGL